jgi:hypothetical protein
MGMALTDSLRMMRTAQVWSYREANRASYIANGDVVVSYVWYAELDDKTCPVCISQHGSVHGLDEVLDGHFNCRCAMLPLTIGAKNDILPGSEWFDQLPKGQQESILGREKYNAWADNKFVLSDLVTRVPNDTYGDMVAERSLKSLLGEE